MTVLDWYDGPAGGVLICEDCSTEYAFTLVDWALAQRIRVFALRPLPAGTSAGLEALLGETPDSPVWVPSRHSQGEDGVGLDDLLRQLLSAAAPPTRIASWDNQRSCVLRVVGLPHEWVRFASPLLERAAEEPTLDWFAALGLDRATGDLVNEHAPVKSPGRSDSPADS